MLVWQLLVVLVVVVGGTTYLRQTGTAITRGLIQPRTYGVEVQYRF